MSRHTPGPWKVTGILQNTGSLTIGAPEQRIVIADVHNAASIGDFLAGAMKRGGGGFEQDDASTQFANANLIAAAPDMLAALQQVAHHADDEAGFMVSVRRAISLAQAEQAKAGRG